MLASVSVCSNVPEFEEAWCFISNGCAKSLIEDVIEYMLMISESSNILLLDHYNEYLQALDENSGLKRKFEEYPGKKT